MTSSGKLRLLDPSPLLSLSSEDVTAVNHVASVITLKL